MSLLKSCKTCNRKWIYFDFCSVSTDVCKSYLHWIYISNKMLPYELSLISVLIELTICKSGINTLTNEKSFKLIDKSKSQNGN